MPQNCLLTGIPITAENDSCAHIIPSALGGRLKPMGLLCKNANGSLNDTVDLALIHAFEPIMSRLDGSRDRGTNPSIRMSDVCGRTYNVAFGKPIALEKPDCSFEEQADGSVQVRVLARTPKEMRTLLGRVKGRFPAFDIEAAAQRAAVTNIPSGILKMPIQIGPVSTFPAGFVAANIFAAHHGFAPHPKFAKYVSSLSSRPDPKPLPPDTFLWHQPPWFTVEAKVSHVLALIADPMMQRMLAFVEYFNIASIAVVLPYAGSAHARKTYAIDVLKGVEAQVTIDESSLAKLQWSASHTLGGRWRHHAQWRKLYLGLQVTRQIQSDWLSEDDIGILARNLDSSLIDLRLVSGFTIGLRTLGDGRGFEDSTLLLGRILNNRYGLDAHAATATAWNTSIRYYGGHFACGTGINPALDRFGVRFSRGAADAYNNHNRHVFDAPNFELRQLDPNSPIPFLNETNGTAIIARNMRMEGCSPFAARHTAAATDCEYDVAWAQSYAIGVDYTPSATRAGNAVFNRHRAPTSRLTRLLAHIPNIRAAAFWQSSTEIGVEGACIMATSTTVETTMAALSWNGLNGIAPTARGLLLTPNRGIGFLVQTTHAKEFALAHWLVGGADGGRLCLRCFDGAGIVRESIAGDALASGTTLQWAPTSKTWQAGAVMQESDLNRRQTVRFGPEVAFAQIGIIGFDGQIEVEALRLYGLPEDAPAILSGCPALPAGGRTLMFSASWDLPSMPPGATSNADVTVPGARRGDFADASLDTSSIAFVLDCHVWSNDKVRVTARNVSLSTVDLPAAALHVQVVKRRVG